MCQGLFLQQGVNPLQELVGQLSKECACFPLAARGDDDELNCTLPKPCSHFSCHVRSREQSAGVGGDRTGVGSRRWMPSPRRSCFFGSSASWRANAPYRTSRQQRWMWAGWKLQLQLQLLKRGTEQIIHKAFFFHIFIFLDAQFFEDMNMF